MTELRGNVKEPCLINDLLGELFPLISFISETNKILDDIAAVTR